VLHTWAEAVRAARRHGRRRRLRRECGGRREARPEALRCPALLTAVVGDTAGGMLFRPAAHDATCQVRCSTQSRIEHVTHDNGAVRLCRDGKQKPADKQLTPAFAGGCPDTTSSVDEECCHTCGQRRGKARRRCGGASRRRGCRLRRSAATAPPRPRSCGSCSEGGPCPRCRRCR